MGRLFPRSRYTLRGKGKDFGKKGKSPKGKGKSPKGKGKSPKGKGKEPRKWTPTGKRGSAGAAIHQDYEEEGDDQYQASLFRKTRLKMGWCGAYNDSNGKSTCQHTTCMREHGTKEEVERLVNEKLAAASRV